MQRELRTRKFPLLERLERMNQKEHEFDNFDSGVKETSTFSKVRLPVAPITTEPTVKVFTKLALLNNKRRYR